MSPEQVTGRELDTKSDQFTAAIVLAELSPRARSFPVARDGRAREDPRRRHRVLERHGRHIAPDIKLVLTRALSRRRDDRFPTTSAYVDALEEVVRRRRLTVNSATLVEWLQRMALVKPNGRSGEHALEGAPVGIPQAPGRVDKRLSPLPPKASGAQPIWSRGVAPVSDSMPPTDAAPAVYRILHPDVTTQLSLAELVELLVSGRALGHTPVSRDEGAFKPAREHAELARLCGGANALWDEAAAVGTDRVAGKLRPGELPGRLFDLALRRATGFARGSSSRAREKGLLCRGRSGRSPFPTTTRSCSAPTWCREVWRCRWR